MLDYEMVISMEYPTFWDGYPCCVGLGENSQAVLGDGGHRPLLVAGRTEQVEAWFRLGPAGPVTALGRG